MNHRQSQHGPSRVAAEGERAGTEVRR